MRESEYNANEALIAMVTDPVKGQRQARAALAKHR